MVAAIRKQATAHKRQAKLTPAHVGVGDAPAILEHDRKHSVEHCTLRVMERGRIPKGGAVAVTANDPCISKRSHWVDLAVDREIQSGSKLRRVFPVSARERSCQLTHIAAPCPTRNVNRDDSPLRCRTAFEDDLVQIATAVGELKVARNISVCAV